MTISIVIPVYNEADHLGACLEAIAVQAVKPLEVIVVDNNSTDGTAEVAKAFDSVTVIHEPQQGVVHARNRGFDAAHGDIIGRIDADTIVPTDWIKNIKSIYAQAGTPRLFAVTAPSNFRNFPGFFWRFMHKLTYFWPSHLLLGHTTFVGSNMFITRHVWHDVRYQVCKRTDLHEDMDLALHVGNTGTRILFLQDLRASVLARKMLRRSISYPAMMIRIRFANHQSDYAGLV